MIFVMGKDLLENINCKEVHNTVLIIITSDDSFSAPAQETCLSEAKISPHYSV